MSISLSTPEKCINIVSVNNKPLTIVIANLVTSLDFSKNQFALSSATKKLLYKAIFKISSWGRGPKYGL